MSRTRGEIRHRRLMIGVVLDGRPDGRLCSRNSSASSHDVTSRPTATYELRLLNPSECESYRPPVRRTSYTLPLPKAEWPVARNGAAPSAESCRKCCRATPSWNEVPMS